MCRTVLIVGMSCLLMASGCQYDNGGPTAAGIATKQAMIRGVKAADDRDWTTANTELTTVLTGTGLQPDERIRALRTRARARIELGHLDNAEYDLLELQNAAAGEMDRVYLLKCEWALKKGYPEEAKAAFEEARKINSEVKPPVGLNLPPQSNCHESVRD